MVYDQENINFLKEKKKNCTTVFVIVLVLLKDWFTQWPQESASDIKSVPGISKTTFMLNDSLEGFIGLKSCYLHGYSLNYNYL